MKLLHSSYRMSREIRHTGGSKEFHYTTEDIERIESQDTDSTKDFKAFQCVHGDEGLAYWETVGKQPGEI